MGLLFDWVSTMAAIGVAGLSALYYFQGNLLFFPTRGEEYTPSQFQLPFDEIAATSADGTRIHGWIIKQQDAKNRPTIIFAHGNAGNLSNRLMNAKAMYDYLGASIVLWSYRGYGKSDDVKPTEKGLVQDAQAVLDVVLDRTDIDTNRVVLFGRSLGGAVMAQTAHANQERIAGVMLENTFTSIGDMVDVIFPKLAFFKPLMTNRFETARILGEIDAHVLIVAGVKDELIPNAHSRRLHKLCRRGTLVEFPEGRHNDTWMHSGYYAKLKAWLESVVG